MKLILKITVGSFTVPRSLIVCAGNRRIEPLSSHFVLTLQACIGSSVLIWCSLSASVSSRASDDHVNQTEITSCNYGKIVISYV